MKIKEVKYEKTSRKDFSKVGDYIEMPNLIKVQKDSYDWFVEEGLGEVLKDISPIVDYTGNLVLEFFDYYMEDKTKYSLEEAKERDATYSTRLHVKVRLINRESGEIKEQEIYLGDFPLMTDSGTFIINGAERVVVSQLVRSPGCYYDEIFDTKTGKKTYTSTVMPLRGAWIEYETDGNDMFWVRVDRTRKIPVTTLLRAIGLISDDQIRALFGEENLLETTIQKDTIKTDKAIALETTNSSDKQKESVQVEIESNIGDITKNNNDNIVTYDLKKSKNAQEARQNFYDGANCSQAVLKAFAKEMNLTEEFCLKLGSSFGGGIGRMRKTCGALTAIFLIAGIVRGYSNLDDIVLKGEHYSLIQFLSKEFEKSFGATECKDILHTTDTSPYPTPRTPDFYASRPCADIIAFSAGLVEEFVLKKTNN